MAKHYDSEEEYDDRPSNGIRPEDIKWYSFLLVLIAAPLTIVTAYITYWVHTSQRVLVKHILTYGFAPLALISLPFANKNITSLIESWTITLPSMISQKTGLIDGIFTMLAQQLPISLLLGVLIGCIYSYIHTKNLPEWEVPVWRKSPLQLMKIRKTRKAIAFNTHKPHPASIKDLDKDDGMTLGIDEFGDIVTQTYKDSYVHTLVTGSPGTGKTKTLLSRIRDAIRAGQGVVIIDFKGGNEIPKAAEEFSRRYGRKFHHWTMLGESEKYSGPAPDGPSYYDPLGRGNSTRRKDLVLGMRNWSEQHYKLKTGVILELLFKTMIMDPQKNVSSFDDVANLLDLTYLQERAAKGLAGDKDYQVVMKEIDRLNDERKPGKELEILDNIRVLINEMRLSVAGRFLKKNTDNPELNIDLLQAARKGRVVVFSLDAGQYETLSAYIGNLIVQDMKTVSGELRKLIDQLGERNPMQFMIDEFASMDSEAVLQLMNKCRDAKVGVTLSTQSIADLAAVSPTFHKQITSNTNSYIFHKENDYDNAEVLAKLSGTRRSQNVSRNYNQDTNSDSAVVRLDETEEYVVSISDLQHQETGQAFYINNSERHINGSEKQKKVYKFQGVLEDPSVSTNAKHIDIDEESDSESYLAYMKKETSEIILDKNGMKTLIPSSEYIYDENSQEAFTVPARPARENTKKLLTKKEAPPIQDFNEPKWNDEYPEANTEEEDFQYGMFEAKEVDYNRLNDVFTPTHRNKLRNDASLQTGDDTPILSKIPTKTPPATPLKVPALPSLATPKVAKPIPQLPTLSGIKKPINLPAIPTKAQSNPETSKPVKKKDPYDF